MNSAGRLICLSLLAALSSASAPPRDSDAALNRKLTELRQNPPELYAFLYRMPKGADLHNHLSGAVYAESYIDAAAALDYCIDKIVMALAAPPCKPGQPDAAETQTDNDLRNKLIDSLSLRNFIAGPESGHDHFFATFGKFGPGGSGQFIAQVVAARPRRTNRTWN